MVEITGSLDAALYWGGEDNRKNIIFFDLENNLYFSNIYKWYRYNDRVYTTESVYNMRRLYRMWDYIPKEVRLCLDSLVIKTK